MEINLQAGFDECRAAPPGHGVQSHSVGGFGIYMLSNHDPDDTFTLRVVALFIPERRRTFTWRSVTPDQVLTIVAALAGFSDRHFGESASDIEPFDRELLADIESDRRNH